jgi:hypothetical protein
MLSSARNLSFILYTQVLATLIGCVSNSPNALPKYQPPAPGNPAATIDVGSHGRAWSVDGTETPSFANTLRLAPGEHRVGLNCLSYDTSTAAVVAAAAAVGGAVGGAIAASAVPQDKPPSTLQFVLVTGRFEAGKTYYSRCVAVDGKPHAWLADSPDGGDLPQGFTSLCTRGCPR